MSVESYISVLECGNCRHPMPKTRAGTAPSAPQIITQELADHAEVATALLKCIANPHRLMILCLLAEAESSVGALNAHVRLSQSALSQHLAVLRTERLVGTRREAQTVYYHIEPGPVLEIIRVLHHHFCSRTG